MHRRDLRFAENDEEFEDWESDWDADYQPSVRKTMTPTEREIVNIMIAQSFWGRFHLGLECAWPPQSAWQQHSHHEVTCSMLLSHSTVMYTRSLQHSVAATDS